MIRRFRALDEQQLTDAAGLLRRAAALYESLGFRQYGRLDRFVAVGDRRWDKVFYALDLR